ncbi:hypothetical protein [Streptomyces glaucescens]|uniref:Uncharacterized protein n=1 Tax=Streptomyces glaucescens TaxID=1907 RepID=A0A089YY15_STRGA|nr:hypothetical protein [Streptomyces glaucescens]AIR98555.1 hypothetical protein SGLAU_12800 [Streptomyces glaucescens]
MVEDGMETGQSIDPRTPPPTPHAAWDLVTVPARQGLEAVDILRRGDGEGVGPVLHDGDGDTLGFLVPPGTAAGWDVPGSTCTRTDGRGLGRVTAPPAPGVADTGADRADCTCWILPPDEADRATDPAVLRRALGEAARMLAAADSCR